MSFKKRLFCYFLSTLIIDLNASKINEAFKALDVYDYFKAKKFFYSELKKTHRSAAAYGLATIFYRPDNPFHNIDSASKYISLSGNHFKQKRCAETYLKFTIDSVTINTLADSIARRSLDKASKANSILAYEDFIASNPYANKDQRLTAFYLRDELFYKQNEAYNSSDSTRQFILRFPESYFLSDYFLLLDKQVFDESTVSKTTEQYIEFLAKNPENKFVKQAEDELFSIYQNNKNPSELEFYVNHYPQSHFINEAWKLLYALSVKSYNTEELQNFVSRYPNFPFKESIQKEIALSSKILIPVNDDDLAGFIDTSGKYAIRPQFDAATPFREGLSVVIRNDSAWFINKENENVFNTFYREAFPFINGIAPVNIDDQWFLINRQGQKTAGPYQDLSEQSENVYIVKQNNKYGAIDVYGNPIIQPQFDKMGDFKNGIAYYLNNGAYGFVKKSGTHSPARYQWISDFDENRLAIIKQNNAYGLVNTSDSIILSPQFELIVKAKHNIFIVVKNGKYGFYNGEGCYYSDVDYDFRKELPADYYTNGRLFKLIKNKKQALMDINGKLTIDYGTYEEVNFAQENLIRVKRNGKYGFADRKLNIVIPCKYNSATDFMDSVSVCTLKQETFLINTKGEELIRTSGSIEPITGGYFLVKDESGSNLTDRKGKVIFSKVQDIQVSQESYVIIELEGNLRKVLNL